VPGEREVLPFLPPNPPHFVRGEESQPTSPAALAQMEFSSPLNEVEGGGGEKWQHLPSNTKDGLSVSNPLERRVVVRGVVDADALEDDGIGAIEDPFVDTGVERARRQR
jgi:hypothetical protein